MVIIDNKKIIKVGDSNYIHISAEFIKAFKLKKYLWNMEISNDGKTITYNRAGLNKDYIEPDKKPNVLKGGK